MTILTGPVSSTDNTFSVSDDSLLDRAGLPQMLQIESEKFLIRGYEPVGVNFTRWFVERGVDGSTKASHSGGVAITTVSSGGGGLTVTDGTTEVAATTLQLPSGTVADAGGGTAGVHLVPSVLGPFQVTHTELDPVAAVKLVDLVDDTLVIRAWAILRELFSTVNEEVFVTVRPQAGSSLANEIREVVRFYADDHQQLWEGLNMAAEPYRNELSASEDHSGMFTRVVWARTSQALWASNNIGSNTTGIVDIYALVASLA